MKHVCAVLACATLASCATPSNHVWFGCISDPEWETNLLAWTRTAAPSSSAELIAKGWPYAPNRRGIVWFRANDGRVSACDADRYHTRFVVFANDRSDANIIDEGESILLVN
jgi:hypothetical protein